MNAHRTLLAIVITAVAGLSVACSAPPGEGTGQASEALKPCVGLNCNGSGTQPPPSQWVDTCVARRAPLASDATLASYPFEVLLKALSCDAAVMLTGSSGQSDSPQYFGTSCPTNTFVTAPCPPESPGHPAGPLVSMNSLQLVQCYAKAAPWNPDAPIFNPCTGQTEVSGEWVDFDPLCSGLACKVKAGGGSSGGAQ